MSEYNHSLAKNEADRRSLLDRFNNSPPEKASPTSTSSSSLPSATTDTRSSASASSPSSSDSAQTNGSGSGGLSSTTKIAIGVGAGAGSLLVLAVIAGCFICRRKQKTRRMIMTPNRDSAPSPMESFYVQGGTIHKKDDGFATEYKVAPSDRVSRQSSNAGSGPGGPVIPPRSPGRTVQRGRGAEDSFF